MTVTHELPTHIEPFISPSSIARAFEKLSLRQDGGLKASFDALLNRTKTTQTLLASDAGNSAVPPSPEYMGALRRLKAAHVCCAERRQARADTTPFGGEEKKGQKDEEVKLSRDERTLAAEGLFRQTMRGAGSTSSPAMQTLVVQSIEAVTEPSVSKVMWGNIIVAGGNTALGGFAARLQNELSFATRTTGVGNSSALVFGVVRA